MTPPHSHIINVLMNFPLTTAWKSTLWFPAEDYTVIPILLRIMSETILTLFPTDGTAIDDCIGHPMVQGMKFDDVFPPLLLLLLNIARQDEVARQMIRLFLMPIDMYILVANSY